MNKTTKKEKGFDHRRHRAKPIKKIKSAKQLLKEELINKEFKLAKKNIRHLSH